MKELKTGVFKLSISGFINQQQFIGIFRQQQ